MLETSKSAIKHAIIKYLLWRETQSQRADRVIDLEPVLWGCDEDSHGRLKIGGALVQDLVDTYGTPLHIINQNELLRSYRSFIEEFEAVQSGVVLATSYKTNPVPFVLKTLHQAGTFAEVISHFELWLALRLGVAPSKIILNGPGKGDRALELAVTSGIRIINIDGPDEIERLAQLVRQRQMKQRVGLRVVTSVGWSSQFGLRIASGEAEAAFVKVQAHSDLLPCGLHLHLGTGIQNVETFVRAVNEVAEFSDHLYENLGITIDHYDLGGGFGVPTVRTMTDWDTRMLALGYSARLANPGMTPTINDYATALKPLLQRLGTTRDGSKSSPTIVFEPGRAITSSAQILALSVIGTKPGMEGKINLFLDGGKNITMPLGWETHQIFAANKMKQAQEVKYDIFGPLCHPGDVVAKNRKFPKLGKGDILAIMDAGAYFIPNQTNFSNPRPAIVRSADGSHNIVRERESFDDVVRLDRV